LKSLHWAACSCQSGGPILFGRWQAVELRRLHGFQCSTGSAAADVPYGQAVISHQPLIFGNDMSPG
jgi:hypothetical protein